MEFEQEEMPISKEAKDIHRAYVKELKKVVGKRIKSIRLHKASDGNGDYFYDPSIEFTDGSIMRFAVSETNDGGAYGVTPVYPASPDR